MGKQEICPRVRVNVQTVENRIQELIRKWNFDPNKY
jgi:hypothetical protein